MIFDTHAHYDDEAFDKDREELLSGLFEKGVDLVVNAGASARSLPRIWSLAHTYDFLYGAAGLHPCEVYGSGDNIGKPVMHRKDSDNALFERAEYSNAAGIWKCMEEFSGEEIITADWRAGEREERLIGAMLGSQRIVAVGEIGLDYHYDDTRKEVQKDWFARQIAMARSHHLPVIIHSRDAAADTLDMVRTESCADVGGIIHCFSYSKEMAKEYMDMGFYIGIGGVVTYKNSLKIKDVVSYMPMDRMVLETDCPYLAPAPFRGKRNDSSLIKYVVQAIAALKGISEDDVERITHENACELLLEKGRLCPEQTAQR